MNKPETNKVEAFQCPFCRALYLEEELANSCGQQCQQVLATARFGIDDEIALIREGDNRLFTVIGVRLRRGQPGNVRVAFECVDADGKAFVYPSAIVMSKIAKLNQQTTA